MADNIIEFKSLADKSTDELVTMIQAGKLKPANDAEADRIRKLAATDVGSPERAALLADDPTPSDYIPPIDGAAVNVQDPKTGKVAVDEPPPPPTIADKSAPVADKPVSELSKDDDLLGFGSLEELKAAFRKKDELLIETDKKHRATNGRLGNDLRAERLRLEALQEQIKRGTVVAQDEPLVSPKIPKAPAIPNPSRYEDGVLDQDYLAACNEYDNSYKAYEASLDKYNDDLLSYQAKLATKSSDERVRAIEERFEAEKKESTKSQEWNNLWQEVADIQKRYGLETTIPVATLNEYVAQMNDPSASAEDRATAKRFLDAIPPTDKMNFDRLTGAVNSFYDFSTGVPRKTERTFEGFLYNNGMQDWLERRPANAPAHTATAPVPEKPVKQYAQVMSAANVGSADVSTRGSYELTAEITAEYKALSDESISHGGTFYRDTSKVARLHALEEKLGLR